MRDVAIIGGGASGLICACAAAEAARAAGISLAITIYEAHERVGRKILASGNGRCNFSNAYIDVALYNDPSFVARVLTETQAQFEKLWGTLTTPNCVTQYFVNHGLLFREEGEGRLYPLANKSSVVLDILRSCAKAYGVQEETGVAVRMVVPPQKDGGRFTLHRADKTLVRADFVVCAAGDALLREMLPAHLPYTERTPVLCALQTPREEVRKMQNIRVKCEVSLMREQELVAQERGELMFRDYGVSGISVFNLSRFAEPNDLLAIDLLPDMSRADLENMLEKRHTSLSSLYGVHLTYEAYMRGMVLPLVAEVMLARLGYREDDTFDAVCIPQLAHTLKSFAFEVLGPADIEHAQGARGGFEVASFSPTTLEASAVPGLHVTGEALHIDGPCGGYNLHWAFATGMLAGIHCAQLAASKR